MNWQQMIRPEKIQVTSNPTYGKFVCEPLERGFGITIGNSLRRIILSSLYGVAITAVKFEGVMHEFSVVPGVLEDVSEIILNLKEVRFRVEDPKPKTVRLDVSGEKDVVAGDIVSEDGRCTVLNPKQHIATLSGKGALRMELTVKAGKGYTLAEDNKEEEAPTGTIPMPITRRMSLMPVMRSERRRT
jgi:DNA-directed RNA polymerase subunit alpha